jgi:hypothetical protein
MNSSICQTINNNRGSTIILALLMMTALSLSAFMAAKISLTDSKLMRSHRDHRDLLYNAETGITVASEDHLTGWLQGSSVLFNLTNWDADISNQGVSIDNEDGDSIDVAQYSVARIEDYVNNATVSSNLNTDALTRSFYPLPHIAPPTIGSGSSPKNFEIRRYGVLSSAIDRRNNVTNLTIESGLSKLFNK